MLTASSPCPNRPLVPICSEIGSFVFRQISRSQDWQRTDGRTNERTDGHVENIVPHSNLDWRMHTNYTRNVAQFMSVSSLCHCLKMKCLICGLIRTVSLTELGGSVDCGVLGIGLATATGLQVGLLAADAAADTDNDKSSIIQVN